MKSGCSKKNLHKTTWAKMGLRDSLSTTLPVYPIRPHWSIKDPPKSYKVPSPSNPYSLSLSLFEEDDGKWRRSNPGGHSRDLHGIFHSRGLSLSLNLHASDIYVINDYAFALTKSVKADVLQARSENLQKLHWTRSQGLLRQCQVPPNHQGILTFSHQNILQKSSCDVSICTCNLCVTACEELTVCIAWCVIWSRIL